MKANSLLKSKWSFVFVLAFAFALCFPAASSKVFAADSNESIGTAVRTINITGNGEVNLTPDIAYLVLGTTTDSATIIEAQSVNLKAINNVINAIKSMGINNEDIKTADYSIYPKYDYDKNTGSSKLVGYTVSSTLNVTVKDISKVGQIIDTAVKNGANITNSISFGISNYDESYNKALLNAISNAQRKAKAISDFLGIKLGAPEKILENSSGTPVSYPVPMNDKLSVPDSSASTSIQTGTYKVKASVSLVYGY